MLEELKKWRQYQVRCESANWRKEEERLNQQWRDREAHAPQGVTETNLMLETSPTFAKRLGIEPDKYEVLEDGDGWLFCWLNHELRLVFRFDSERKIDGVVWFADMTRTTIEPGEIELTRDVPHDAP